MSYPGAPAAGAPLPPISAPGGGSFGGAGGPAFVRGSTTAVPAGGTPVAPSMTPPVKAEPPKPGFMEQMKKLSENKGLMGGLGKLAGAAGGGGGGGGQGPDMSIAGSGGDPTGASRANAAKLFASVLEGHLPQPAGAVPHFPKGLLEGF